MKRPNHLTIEEWTVMQDMREGRHINLFTEGECKGLYCINRITQETFDNLTKLGYIRQCFRSKSGDLISYRLSDLGHDIATGEAKESRCIEH